MKAIIYALLSAFVWGTAPLIFKLGLKGNVPSIVGIFFHNLTAALVALLSILIVKESLNYPHRDLALISFGGFVSGFLGLWLYYQAIKYGQVSVVAPIVASSPLWSSLLAFAFLGESLSLQKLIGTLLVVAGVILLTTSQAGR